MRRRPNRGGNLPAVIVGAFVAGTALGWWAHDRIGGWVSRQTTRQTDRAEHDVELPPRADKATGTSQAAPRHTAAGGGLAALGGRALRVPIDNANVNAMVGQFDDRRDGGTRGHEAVDLIAPRNAPIHAVDDGRIAKLFESRAGGTTIYQYDPSGRLCYYYAHLQSYAPGLHEGQQVSRGDVIGFVGTSGNAPPDRPHLHFAIFELEGGQRWWEGRPVDPFPAFAR